MNNIIFIEATLNYPFGFSAGNTKVHFLCKGLKKAGSTCTIINSSKSKIENRNGNFEGIPFWLTSGSYIKFCYETAMLIKKLYKKDMGNFIIITAPNLLKFFSIWILSKLYGYKLLGLYHEYYQATYGRRRWDRKILSKWFDHNFGYFCDAILPISEFLIRKCKRFNRPILKVPVVADFDSYVNMSQQTSCSSYFLYCGKTAYSKVIYTIIESFLQFNKKNDNNIKLRLVLHGYKDILDEIKRYVAHKNLTDKIEFYENLDYNTLIEFYKNAIALFIPMDKYSIQEQARFSQKIAEYLSAKRPILTVNTGEIPYYFTDKENAFIVEDLQDNLIAKQLMWIVEHPKETNAIGLNGFKTGLTHFDYLFNGKAIHEFLLSLNE